MKKILIGILAFGLMWGECVPQVNSEMSSTNRLVAVNYSTSQPAVKMSRTKICHAKGSTYYKQTKYFTAFKSMQDCLNAGGRYPKR